MRLFRFTIASLMLLATAQAQSPVLPDAVRATADRITAAQLGKDLAFLASDELGGRNTPSPGFDRAAEFIAARLTKAGVKPLGDAGTYFQRYEMHESRVDTGATYLEVDGKKFAFGTDLVIRSFGGELSGALPAVYVGHGWSIPASSIDPYAGVEVKGKIVIAHGPRALACGM